MYAAKTGPWVQSNLLAHVRLVSPRQTAYIRIAITIRVQHEMAHLSLSVNISGYYHDYNMMKLDPFVS